MQSTFFWFLTGVGILCDWFFLWSSYSGYSKQDSYWYVYPIFAILINVAWFTLSRMYLPYDMFIARVAWKTVGSVGGILLALFYIDLSMKKIIGFALISLGTVIFAL